MNAVKTIQLGKRVIGDGQPCFIVAEAGVNHNGSVAEAKQLIKVASEINADAVKFQKRTVEDILTREALQRPYVGPNSYGATYGEHRQKLELPDVAYQELKQYAEARKIFFLASAWDLKSAEFLDTLGVQAFKIASADVTNLPLLERIAHTRKPVLLSSGMSTLEEIGEALDVIRACHDQIVLLHCVSTYPTEPEDINLRVLRTLRETFDVVVGYSGHEQGIVVSQAAVALGAAVVERHFTLDWTARGPDHEASLQPDGFKKLVTGIRKVEQALGRPEKTILESELTVRHRLAKSIVAGMEIHRGTVISPEMLALKSPGTGLKSSYLNDVIGTVAEQHLKLDELLPLDAIKWKRSH